MNSFSLGRKPRDRFRRVLRRAVLVLVAGLLSVFAIHTAFRRWTGANEDAEAVSSVDKLRRSVRVDKSVPFVHIARDRNWLEYKDGIWRLFLFGEAEHIGYFHGLLSSRLMADVERQIAKHIFFKDHGIVSRWWVKQSMRWSFRRISKRIHPAFRRELSALNRSKDELVDLPENAYQRLIYLQAPFMVERKLGTVNLLGANSFVAWGSYSVNRRMLIGRSLRWRYLDRVLQRNQMVMVYRGPNSIPFVSVGWPGMIGVTTGVNAKQLFVSLNSARTDTPQEDAQPAALTARRILERASTLAQAQKIIRQSDVPCAVSFLLADGKTSEAVVIEASPGRIYSRRPDHTYLAVTDHFRHPAFRADAQNDRMRRYGSSEVRYRRMIRLVRRFRTRIDPSIVASILRDRKGLDDEPLALGHGRVLDSIDAALGVIVDVSSSVLWINRGPALLGSFEPIDLRPIFGTPIDLDRIPRPIPADEINRSIALKYLNLSRREMAHARRLWARGSRQSALRHARLAFQTTPRLPRAAWVLGSMLYDGGHEEEAKRVLKTFVELHPADRERAERAQARLVSME